MATVYIAGPMRGRPKHNFPAFDRAAEVFRRCCYDVISPADLDRQQGLDENTTEVTDDMLRRCMERDTNAICRCSHIALLHGWQESRGVRAEAVLAFTLGLKFLVQVGHETFLSVPAQGVMEVIGRRLIQAA